MAEHLTPRGLMTVDQVNRFANILIDEAQLIEVYFFGFDRILPLEEKKKIVEKLGIKRKRPLVTNFPGGISVISEAIERHSVSIKDVEEEGGDESSAKKA